MTPPQQPKVSGTNPSAGESADPELPKSFAEVRIPQQILRNLTPVKSFSRRRPCVRRLFATERRDRLRHVLAQKSERAMRKKSAFVMGTMQTARRLQEEYERAISRRQQHLAVLKGRAASLLRRLVHGPCNKENDLLAMPGLHFDHAKPRFAPSGLPLSDCYNNVLQLGILTQLSTCSFDALEQLTNCLLTTGPLVTIFRSLGVERVLPYFYSYFLVAEFRDCMRNGLVHPGYNANSSNDEIANFCHNFVWLLLYKTSMVMHTRLEALVRDQDCAARDAFVCISAPFEMLFSVFKRSHHESLTVLLASAINIVTEQMRIAQGDQVILQQCSELRQGRQGLLAAAPHDLNGDAHKWVVQLHLHVQECFLGSIPASSRHRVMVCDPQFLRYNYLFFPMPSTSQIGLVQWRQYWFKRFHDAPIRSAPPVMRTGPVGSIRRKLLYCNIDMVLGPNALEERYRTLYTHDDPGILSNMLADVFLDLVQYVRVCCDAKPTENVHNALVQIQSGEGLHDALMSFFDTMRRMAKTHRVAEVAVCALECMQNVPHTRTGPHHAFLSCLERLELTVQNAWLAHCAFSSIREFTTFESVYAYTGSNNFQVLRFNVHTNSPCLHFPRLYAQLARNSDVGVPLLADYHYTLDASYGAPDVHSTMHDMNSKAFFRRVIGKMIICGKAQDLEWNEINDLFREQMIGLNYLFAHLIAISACYSMWRVYTGESTTPNERRHMQAHFYRDGVTLVLNTNHGISSGFREYYRRHHRSIRGLIESKILERFVQTGRKHPESGRFSHYQEEIEVIYRQIEKLLAFIYQVYHPILNWVYQDLNRPG